MRKDVEESIVMRDSNIELLRIISMLLIVATHTFGTYSDIIGSQYPWPQNWSFFYIMKAISYIAVNMYVMIGAYFLCTLKFRSKRVVKFWLEIFFYSIIIGFVGLISGAIGGGKYWFSMLFPILGKEYWFATIYLGLLVLSPFLNISLRAMNERALRYFCITLIILFSVIPSLIINFNNWLNFGNGVGIVWFVTLYYVSAYIRLYVDKESLKKNRAKLFWGGLFFCISPFAMRVIIVLLTNFVMGKAQFGGLFYGNEIILPFVATVFVFLYFLSIDIKNSGLSSLINWVARGTFGVYLIHEHPWVRKLLKDLAPDYLMTEQWYYPLQSIVWIVSIYVICTLIDGIRQVLFIPINKLKMVKLEGIDRRINDL